VENDRRIDRREAKRGGDRKKVAIDPNRHRGREWPSRTTARGVTCHKRNKVEIRKGEEEKGEAIGEKKVAKKKGRIAEESQRDRQISITKEEVRCGGGTSDGVYWGKFQERT